MKLVYAVDKGSYAGKDHIGVVKKVESQMRLFQCNGMETTLCQYEWKNGYPNIEIENDTDILYFRRITPSVKMLLTLYQLKRKSHGIRTIMEIPTYPFDAEGKKEISLKTRINTWIGEKLLKTCVDRIVLIAQPSIKKIYGIPVLNINNGVEFDNIPVKKQSQNKENEIHLICVSGCFFWHGYDRLIKGMQLYYAKQGYKEDVIFHIVGDGACLEEYKDMAVQYGLLNSKVFFYGIKQGEELNEIYDRCDVAIECLGCHRKNIFYVSSLKAREYAAKGMPMIAANDIDIRNDKTEKYIKIFPADDSPIEIEEVIKFYHEIYDGKEKNDVASEIREIFYPYCDWKFVCKSVLKYINEG